MCRCDCGTTKYVNPSSLKDGSTKSCGCLNRDRVKLNTLKHGHSSGGRVTTEFQCYRSIIARTTNPNRADWKNYGGRGVSVHPNWLGDGGFLRFLDHIGLKPHPGLSIDRIDNNGNYEPGNVRWATRKQQRNNQRKNLKNRGPK